jgi:cell division septation protein DedD
MARDWRRAVLAALAVAMLGGACVLAAQAQTPAEAEAEEEPAKEAAPGAQPNAPGKKRQDPAEAQRAIDAALKQLQAGRAEQAVQALSATLAGGNLPPAILAKALYVRGVAHRQQRRPAQAVSDLSSALWLKGGLGGDERADAIKERAAAYADAGLTDRGDPTDASQAPTKTSGGNWLSGLFGAPSSSPSAPARAPAAPPPPRAPAPAAAPSAWTSQTQVAAAPAAPLPRAQTRTESAPARAEPPQARLDGGYLVQLAAVRTEAEAQALAAKAKREQVLASRQSRIERAVLGNMGAFYLVRFGRFASAQETQAVCAKLQGSGFDCTPVGP